MTLLSWPGVARSANVRLVEIGLVELDLCVLEVVGRKGSLFRVFLLRSLQETTKLDFSGSQLGLVRSFTKIGLCAFVRDELFDEQVDRLRDGAASARWQRG